MSLFIPGTGIVYAGRVKIGLIAVAMTFAIWVMGIAFQWQDLGHPPGFWNVTAYLYLDLGRRAPVLTVWTLLCAFLAYEECMKVSAKAVRRAYPGAPEMTEGVPIEGKKSVTTALAVSLVLPGGGTMYAGRVGRGCVEFACSFLLALTGFLFYLVGSGDGDLKTEIAGILFFLGAFGAYAYSAYDATRVCEESNWLWNTQFPKS